MIPSLINLKHWFIITSLTILLLFYCPSFSYNSYKMIHHLQKLKFSNFLYIHQVLFRNLHCKDLWFSPGVNYFWTAYNFLFCAHFPHSLVLHTHTTYLWLILTYVQTYITLCIKILMQTSYLSNNGHITSITKLSIWKFYQTSIKYSLITYI